MLFYNGMGLPPLIILVFEIKAVYHVAVNKPAAFCVYYRNVSCVGKLFTSLNGAYCHRKLIRFADIYPLAIAAFVVLLQL